MTEERELRLRAAGLTFRARGAVWAERVQALEAYRSEHGHCRVPYTYPDDPQLAKWVSKQRSEMKARSEGKKSQLTEERIAQLQELGFWDNAASSTSTSTSDSNAPNNTVASACASAATDDNGVDPIGTTFTRATV